jgi:ATP-dependent RNA helicase CshB
MDIKRQFVASALKDMKFEKFTEIQQVVIPLARERLDVIGCSQTGSGKTHAFLIPIFEALKISEKRVQVVIATPTRELADQIYRFSLQIAGFADETIDIRKYTGGTDRSKELMRLKKSQPQIVIGTPGKLKDLAIDENALKLYQADVLVIDEADMALESGFLEDLDMIAGSMGENLHMMVFSATIPEQLRPFLKKYMHKPEEIFIAPKQLSSLNIKHVFMPIKSQDRDTVLMRLLEILNPYIALIFCSKKETVDELYPMLKKQFSIVKLHGGLSHRERRRVLKEINSGTYQYIIASDIAARGIDIDGVSHVINYDLPRDMEFYIHRTGRTGRANYDGIAISLYSAKDDRYIDYLEQKGITIHYQEIRNGELVDRRERNERQKRKKIGRSNEGLKIKVRRDKKKVKPGYKKKYYKKLQEEKKKVLRKKR